MSLTDITRIFRPSKDRKLSTAEVTADVYARSLSEATRRSWNSVKECARALGVNQATAKNIREGKNGPNGVNLIRGIAESDEVLWTVLELAGRADLVERVKASAYIDQALEALNKLKAGSE